MIIVFILLLIGTIGIGIIAQVKCCRTSRWIKENMLHEWEKLPWFYRKAACGQIGIAKIVKENSIDDSQFLSLFNSWKRTEWLSWILLFTLWVSILLVFYWG